MSVSFRNASPPHLGQRVPGGRRSWAERAYHALARDGPVGTMRDHVEDAVTAPGWDPGDLVLDGIKRALAKPLLVQGDEPLLGGAEERGVLAAPAVRILVAERHLSHERADLPQVLDDPRIRLPHRHTAEELDLGQE